MGLEGVRAYAIRAYLERQVGLAREAVGDSASRVIDGDAPLRLLHVDDAEGGQEEGREVDEHVGGVVS